MKWLDALAHARMVPTPVSNNLLICIENWRSITEADVIEAKAILEIGDEPVDRIIELQRRLIEAQCIALKEKDSQNESAYDPAIGDNIAMIVRLGAQFAFRSPVVSFWSFATLLSISVPDYHEARNYWLSACTAIMIAARRRSWFTHQVYMSVLLAGYDEDEPTSDVLLLPIAELALESGSFSEPSAEGLRASMCAEVRAILDNRIGYAVEDDCQVLEL